MPPLHLLRGEEARGGERGQGGRRRVPTGGRVDAADTRSVRGGGQHLGK